MIFIIYYRNFDTDIQCGWKEAYGVSHAMYEPYLLSQRTRRALDTDGQPHAQQVLPMSCQITKFSDF